MGYYTSFELSWTPHKKCKLTQEELDTQIGAYIEDEDNELCCALEPDGSSYVSIKWYEHMDDMRAVSKKFKDVLFHLTGKGEESGDVWDAFFLNGKGQKHHAELIRAEEPDEDAWE